MLNIVISIKVPRKLIHFTVYQDILYETSHELFVLICFVQIFNFRSTIYHSMSARICRLWSFLEIIPVFHDLTVFPTENIKSDFWAEEVIVSMSERIIAVLKCTNCFDFCTA